MNWKLISRYIGYALLVSALFMFIALLISLLQGNDSALAALIISFTITFLVGIFPFIFVRRTNAITLKEGYVIITLSWLLSFIFGMLPYALWGGPFTLQNAFFESVSGFTTCGATILDNVEALPDSLLFWRASTHFIGGLGVVVFLLLIIPESSQMRMRLTNLELSSLSKSGYSSRAGKVAYVFAYVYLAIFALAFIAYLLAGMSPLDAVCHAMSIVATGGFSTKSLSIAAFGSRAIEAITMVLMFVATIHFGLLYLAVVHRSLKPLNNQVVKTYAIGIAAMTIIVTIGLKTSDLCSNFSESLWSGLFSTLSIASTTGFGLVDNAQWPAWMMAALIFPAIVCGCAGSTSGGIKVDRGLLFVKSIWRHIDSILHPSSINEVRIGRRVIRQEELAPHVLYLLVYVTLIMLSVPMCLLSGMDFEHSVTASVMSIGNVGPASSELGFFGSYNAIPMLGKLTLCADMFLGRVEIFPVLATLAMLFERRK